MRKINKGTEPREWIEHRNTPGADYEATPVLRESLLDEQGYICAYCMRRIPNKDKTEKETSKIEHILSRDNHDDKKLWYSNMAICCPGAISGSGIKVCHCDKKKDNEDITFDLYSDHLFTTLKYQIKDGEIRSDNDEYMKQIGESKSKDGEPEKDIGILNLNNPLLKNNRLQTLNGVIGVLDSIGWTKRNVADLLNKWDSKDGDGKFKPYCGIVTWYLQKKLNSIATR